MTASLPPRGRALADRDYVLVFDVDCGELPWEPSDGGAIAPFEGGATTHGARGTWPLPVGARRLTFTLYPVPPGARFPADRPAGALVVDLREGTARWERRD